MIPKSDLLARVKIAAPCPASWDAMEGDERVRFCGSCRRSVYNLSGMDADAARQLLAGAEGRRLCVRLYRRRDGTVLTRDCPVGLRKARKRVALVVSWGAAAILFAFAFARDTRTTQSADAEPVRLALDDLRWRAQQPASVRMVLNWIDPPDLVVMGAMAPLDHRAP